MRGLEGCCCCCCWCWLLLRPRARVRAHPLAPLCALLCWRCAAAAAACCVAPRQVTMMTWSELLHRLVLVQRSTRLCAARDLDELDVVGRIMRKDNFLIGAPRAAQ